MTVSRDMQGFLRVLDFLTDPVKAKQIADEFNSTTKNAQDKLNELVAKEADLRQREAAVWAAQKDVSQRTSEASDAEVANDKKLKDLEARASELNAVEASQKVRQIDLDNIADAQGKKQMELKQREDAVAESETLLQNERAQVAADQGAVNAKMAQIKSLAE
jgi:hypothetical protein